MELKLIFGLEIWACDFCFCTIRASFAPIRDWIDREFIAHALNIYLCVQGARFDCRRAAESHSSLTFPRQLRVWSFTLKNFSSLLLFFLQSKTFMVFVRSRVTTGELKKESRFIALSVLCLPHQMLSHASSDAAPRCSYFTSLYPVSLPLLLLRSPLVPSP